MQDIKTEKVSLKTHTVDQFANKLKALNYNNEQIEQLIVKFLNNMVLEIQDQKALFNKVEN